MRGVLGGGGGEREREGNAHCRHIISECTSFCILYIYIYIWDSVQLNHPYGTFSKFPEQAKEK